MCTAPAPEPLCYDSASEVSNDRTAVWGTVSCVGPVPRISWSSLSAMGWAGVPQPFHGPVGGVRIMAEEFSVGDWIDRLAGALARLAKAQEPYLPGDRRVRVFLPAIPGVEDGGSPAIRVEELGELYARVRHSHLRGEKAWYAALNSALDPVRYILLRHPTIARAVGPIIGKDNFYMQVLNSGGATSPADLAAGLIARAAEHSGDGFRKAAGELHAFLVAGEEEDGAALWDGLDCGCDVALFHGPVVEERIDVAEDVTLLPFEEVRAFVDEEMVFELAPAGAGFHGFRSVGAAARSFRWRPTFHRAGYERELDSHDAGPFFRRARTFLLLLSVAHAAPVLPLAELSHRIDRSASRLLGRGEQSPGFYRSWPAKGFDGFDECPVLNPEAFAEAKEAFENRKSERYGRMAPVVGRLAEALARNGPFAVADRVMDVGIALERMYVLDGGHISRKLRNRAARYLATDGWGQESIRESAQEFYDVRSDIVHNRLHRLTPERVHAAFCNGFDIARRSVFKLLREGSPEDWGASGNAGEGGSEEEMR